MAQYELRLYKPRKDKPTFFTLIDKIPMEAADDEEAVAKAPKIEIPKWDDSDWAFLFGDDGRKLWRIDRDR